LTYKTFIKMGQLVTQFIFQDEKGRILARTSDMDSMAEIMQKCNGRSFSVGEVLPLAFDGKLMEYEITAFVLYPLNSLRPSGVHVLGKGYDYSCQATIGLRMFN